MGLDSPVAYPNAWNILFLDFCVSRISFPCEQRYRDRTDSNPQINLFEMPKINGTPHNPPPPKFQTPQNVFPVAGRGGAEGMTAPTSSRGACNWCRWLKNVIRIFYVKFLIEIAKTYMWIEILLREIFNWNHKNLCVNRNSCVNDLRKVMRRWKWKF